MNSDTGITFENKRIVLHNEMQIWNNLELNAMLTYLLIKRWGSPLEYGCYNHDPRDQFRFLTPDISYANMKDSYPGNCCMYLQAAGCIEIAACRIHSVLRRNRSSQVGGVAKTEFDFLGTGFSIPYTLNLRNYSDLFIRKDMSVYPLIVAYLGPLHWFSNAILNLNKLEQLLNIENSTKLIVTIDRIDEGKITPLNLCIVQIDKSWYNNPIITSFFLNVLRYLTLYKTNIGFGKNGIRALQIKNSALVMTSLTKIVKTMINNGEFRNYMFFKNHVANGSKLIVGYKKELENMIQKSEKQWVIPTVQEQET